MKLAFIPTLSHFRCGRRRHLRLALSAALLLISVAGPQNPALHAQTLLISPEVEDSDAAVPQEMALQRAAEFVAAMETGDPLTIRNFIQESMVPRSRPDSTFNFLARLQNESQGLELVATVPSESTVQLVVRNRLTGWQERIELFLEPRPPYRIETFAIRSPEPAHISETEVTDDRIAIETEAMLKALASKDAFSGAVLLARGDEVLVSRAYGDANKDFRVPNELHARFELGSMNKMFTAIAIAQLVEAEKLAFDDKLSAFLPDHFAPGAAETIRIKHLLSHTSGLGNYFNGEFMNSPRDRFRTIDDVLEIVRGETPEFDAGTKWQYSNTGYLVLGKVIELVTGEDYHDYVREHVYKPAGMTDTGQFERDRVNRDLAIGYSKRYTEEGVEFLNNLFAGAVRGGPAGGGYSTVRDLHRFARALTDGRLVSPEMVQILVTPKPELSSPHYGYGFRQYSPADSDGEGFVFGHGGEFPGVSAQLNVFPSTGHVLVVLSNYGPEGVFRPIALRKLVSR